MLVLGVDPGSVNTGFAWIRGSDHHVQFGGHKSSFSTSWKNTERMPFRWSRMRGRLENQLKQVPEPPAIVAIEEPFRERCKRVDDRNSLSIFYGAYAIAISEVSRFFNDTIIVPVRYMSWNGGLSKNDIYLRLKERYFQHKILQREDEMDALGVADFAWGIACSSRKKLLCSQVKDLPAVETAIAAKEVVDPGQNGPSKESVHGHEP